MRSFVCISSANERTAFCSSTATATPIPAGNTCSRSFPKRVRHPLVKQVKTCFTSFASPGAQPVPELSAEQIFDWRAAGVHEDDPNTYNKREESLLCPGLHLKRRLLNFTFVGVLEFHAVSGPRFLVMDASANGNQISWNLDNC